jgi:hypothetical protein
MVEGVGTAQPSRNLQRATTRRLHRDRRRGTYVCSTAAASRACSPTASPDAANGRSNRSASTGYSIPTIQIPFHLRSQSASTARTVLLGSRTCRPAITRRRHPSPDRRVNTGVSRVERYHNAPAIAGPQTPNRTSALPHTGKRGRRRCRPCATDENVRRAHQRQRTANTTCPEVRTRRGGGGGSRTRVSRAVGGTSPSAAVGQCHPPTGQRHPAGRPASFLCPDGPRGLTYR